MLCWNKIIARSLIISIPGKKFHSLSDRYSFFQMDEKQYLSGRGGGKSFEEEKKREDKVRTPPEWECERLEEQVNICSEPQARIQFP